MSRQAEPAGSRRREHGRTVADRQDTGKRGARMRTFNRRERTAFVVEPHRHGGVAPRIVERPASIGGQHEAHTGPCGGLGERAHLVAGGGRDEEDGGLGQWSW